VEIGEYVLYSVICFASEQPLALLCVLLIGYVDYYANEAIRLTILAIQALSAHLDPADTRVFLKKPVFLNILFLGEDGVSHCIGDPLNIFGMNAS
jgi:hypothetical protein